MLKTEQLRSERSRNLGHQCVDYAILLLFQRTGTLSIVWMCNVITNRQVYYHMSLLKGMLQAALIVQSAHARNSFIFMDNMV